MRYTFHGGGPSDGALNGAVMPDPLSSGWPPAAVRPRPRTTRHCARLGHSPGLALDHASASRIDTATEHRGSRATLRPFRVPVPVWNQNVPSQPQGTDRSRMRAAVRVDGGQPGRVGVHRVRDWRRPRVEFLGNCGPVHRRQPIRLTQIGDLHEASLHCPADILADSVSQIRRATTAQVIGHADHEPSEHTHASATEPASAIALLGRVEHPVPRSVRGQVLGSRHSLIGGCGCGARRYFSGDGPMCVAAGGHAAVFVILTAGAG